MLLHTAVADAQLLPSQLRPLRVGLPCSLPGAMLDLVAFSYRLPLLCSRFEADSKCCWEGCSVTMRCAGLRCKGGTRRCPVSAATLRGTQRRPVRTTKHKKTAKPKTPVKHGRAVKSKKQGKAVKPRKPATRTTRAAKSRGRPRRGGKPAAKVRFIACHLCIACWSHEPGASTMFTAT